MVVTCFERSLFLGFVYDREIVSRSAIFGGSLISGAVTFRTFTSYRSYSFWSKCDLAK